MTVQPRAWWAAWWMVVPLALAAAVSYPITANYFFGDDLLSLYQLVNKPILELLVVPYAGHLYIVRNVLFTLLFWLFGPDPRACYWMALVTHLVNVALLCILLRALTGSERLACVGAVLWGTAPVTEGTIGWYSVYGHALATTGLLVVLVGIVRAGQRAAVSNWALAGWAIAVFVMSTSFGVGLAFTVLMPFVAWLLMPAGPTRRRATWLLGSMAAVMVLVYAAARRIAAEYYGVADIYAMGPADILAHWAGVADLAGTMLAYGTEQLVLGPLARFAPGTTWPVILAAPVLAGVALAFRAAAPSSRRAMLAFALLAGATYGIIAVGRLDFYPEFKLMLVSTARYHYAAPLAVSVVICVALAQFEFRWAGRRIRSMALGAWLAALGAGLALVRQPYLHFFWARRYANLALNGMDGIIRTAPPGSDVYIENELFHGVGPMVLAVPSNFPGLAGLFVVYHPSNVVDGHRVFFVDADAEVRAAASRGLRSKTLLVAPDDVPPKQEVRRVPTPPIPGWRLQRGPSVPPATN